MKARQTLLQKAARKEMGRSILLAVHLSRAAEYLQSVDPATALIVREHFLRVSERCAALGMLVQREIEVRL